MIPCISDYAIEKQIQEAYTNAKFREFQDELRRKLYCYPHLLSQVDSVSTYEVNEDVKVGEFRKDLKFIVEFNEIQSEFQCICCRFESTGILCRHVLVLMTHLKLNYIPTKYILKRCRKNIKRKYTVVRSNFQDLHGQLHSIRFDKLCHKFFELAEVGAESEDNCELLMGVLEEWKEKIVKRGSICASNVPADSPSQTPRSFEESRVTSPQAVRRKGRAHLNGRCPGLNKLSAGRRRLQKR